MRCDLIIPVWDQLELTKNCIDHIIKNTKYPCRMIIIDNGSRADTKRYLEQLKRSLRVGVELIRNEKNLGFVKAVNQGMRISNAPYVCIMNNDTVPAPGWLEELVEFAEAHKDAGLLNPQCDGDPKKSLEEIAGSLLKNKGKYMEMNQCFGFAMLVKREVIKRIGYLDEDFGVGCYDDTDYSMRAGLAGYRCVNVYSSYVHHVHGVSFKAMGHRNRIVSECEKVFFNKWPRHLRVGISFSLNDKTDDIEVERLLKAMLFMAREWCWINFWVFGDKAVNRRRIAAVSEKIGMPLHQNIKFNYLPGRLKNINLAIRILERSFGTRRRKKYDIVLVDNGPSASFLKAFYSFHTARIYLMSEKGDMITELKRIISGIRNSEKKN